MTVSRNVALLSLLFLSIFANRCLAASAINESARQIPVAYEVDVVVVGGGTGAVSAALAAKEQGAEVFLAAPYPYLGDDMTATLRLWLEEGEVPESPLALRLFNDKSRTDPQLDPNRMEFTYEADQPSVPVHKDTSPPTKLTDGHFGDPSSQSVQYDSNVNITADLGKSKPIESVRLRAFRRTSGIGGTNFDVKAVMVCVSDDKQSWKQIGVVANEKPSADSAVLSLPIGRAARYVRFAVTMPEGVERTLLGELEIIQPATDTTEEPVAKYPAPRPMHIKKTLDEVLIEAGVQFLYSCMVTDVLRDTDGNPCGIVMANRAGRQAVIAKTIIDATDRATVARLAGAEFQPAPAGLHTFKRVVIGGEVQTAENMTSRVIDPPFTGVKAPGGTFDIIEYTLQLPLADDSYAAWAAAEQQARTMTYDPGQQFTSDRLFEVPPDAIRGRNTDKNDPPALGAFQPAGVSRLLVLGGCADVSRELAAKLLRPLALIDMGRTLGELAADEAASLPKPSGVHLPGQPTEDSTVADCEVKETLQGVRPTQELPTIPQEARALPVLGRYDVVVIGGGTGGAPAGIAAARQGAKTLVIEYLHGLGGVGTAGAISKYYWGNRVGFTATIPGESGWIIEQKMEWYRSNLLEAGGELWFGTLGCGAVVQGDRVIGAVVTTPHGRGVVLAKTVIDATGNSDVAASAGAECMYTDASEFGMQGTGLPGRQLGGSYNNTDFSIVDETDMVDVWQMFVHSKYKYPDAFDHGRLIDTRERRRIVGDATITILDQINERTYPDSVVRAYSNFDTHGYTIDPYLILEHPEKRGIGVYIPYRAMLPKGLEGLLVIGLGTSAHRDAVPLIRMQADIQNQGYAAGVAASMAARTDGPLREIDLHALQEHLIEIGNLPASVLTDKDSFPLSDEQFAEAAESFKDGHTGASVLLTDPARALPLLGRAFVNAEPEHRLAYAKALCTLGGSTGVETVVAEVRAAGQWDSGWNYRGMGQFGSAMSPLDNLIVALGRSRDRSAVPAVLEKVELLTAEHDFSHHRAVGLALELIGEPAAAKPLADLLAKPGMRGHVHASVDVAIERETPGGTNAEQTRRVSLRELMLGRALYRCGDHEGIGEEILQAYTKDLRGHLARHAKAVLEAGNQK
ncbi:MAG: FAD-dependent oxidoreductase [Thermoguttaceae bacterium]